MLCKIFIENIEKRAKTKFGIVEGFPIKLGKQLFPCVAVSNVSVQNFHVASLVQDETMKIVKQIL